MRSRVRKELSVTSLSGEERRQKIGLRYGRTGVPLFLLFLKGLQKPVQAALHSLEDLQKEAHQFEGEDRRAWLALASFFQAGGETAHVVASPLTRSKRASIAGKDKGLNNKTGVAALSSFTDIADLVVIPQASSLLNNKEYRSLLQDIKLPAPYFLIADVPSGFALPQAIKFSSGLNNPDTALYYPWLWDGNDAICPSPAVAALYQRNDRNHGIHDLPSNRDLGPFSPIRNVSEVETRTCLENRLNTFLKEGDQTLCWGGSTLASKSRDEDRFVSVRRTLIALKEAIQEICEPFVLEPLSGDLSDAIQVKLQSFLQTTRKNLDTGMGDAFQTKVSIQQVKGEDIIQVDAQFRIPHALNQLEVSLGLTG